VKKVWQHVLTPKRSVGTPFPRVPPTTPLVLSQSQNEQWWYWEFRTEY